MGVRLTLYPPKKHVQMCHCFDNYPTLNFTCTWSLITRYYSVASKIKNPKSSSVNWFLHNT